MGFFWKKITSNVGLNIKCTGKLLPFDKLVFIRIADEIIEKRTIYKWETWSHGIVFNIIGLPSCGRYFYTGYIDGSPIVQYEYTQEAVEDKMNEIIPELMTFWVNFHKKYESFK